MSSQVLGSESFINTPDVNGTLLTLSGTTIPYHGIDRSASSISYVSSTRVLTLTQGTGNFTYWYAGTLVTTGATTATITHSATAGNYYFYFNDTSGTIQSSTSFPGVNLTIVLLASVYWDGTKGTCWDDRHSHNFPISVHSYGHNTMGCLLVSGATLGGYTIQNGTANSMVTYTLSSGVIADEDVQVSTSAVTAGGPYSAWYLNGSTPGWGYSNTLTIPYMIGTNIQYNNGTALTDLTSGQYVNYWLYGAPIIGTPQFIVIVGQTVFNDASSALAETYLTLNLTGLPSKEVTLLYQITYRCDSTYATTGKACIYNVDAININNGGLSDATGIESFQYINMISTNEPPAPASNALALYSQAPAGRMLLKMTDNASLESALQPALFSNNIILWLAGTGTTLAINFGTSFTARNSGTSAAQSTPTLTGTNVVTQMKRAIFGTGTTATGASGLTSAAAVAWRSNIANAGGFYFYCRFALETYVATERIYIGLSATATTLAADPSTLANTIGLSKDSAETTLQLLSVSSTGTITKINTAITPSASQILDFTMFCKPNDTIVTMSILDPSAGTYILSNQVISTNLPANTAFLSMCALIQSTAGTTAKMLSIQRMYLETET